MSPMVCIAIDGQVDKNLMIYGHLDKQPHMTEGWSEGLHPFKPAIRGDLAYGRGISDDGYVVFATVLAIKAAQAQGKKLPRICFVLETEEESGSASLLYLLDKCADIIGTPDVCFCSDAGGLDYNSLWLTSSLRGLVAGRVNVEVMEKGIHSGIGGGIAPESFDIVRNILDKLNNSTTGDVVADF